MLSLIDRSIGLQLICPLSLLAPYDIVSEQFLVLSHVDPYSDPTLRPFFSHRDDPCRLYDADRPVLGPRLM